VTVEPQAVVIGGYASLALGSHPVGSYRLRFIARTTSALPDRLVDIEVRQGNTVLTLLDKAYLWDSNNWSPSATYPTALPLMPYVRFATTTTEMLSVKLTRYAGNAGDLFWLKALRLEKYG